MSNAFYLEIESKLHLFDKVTDMRYYMYMRYLILLMVFVSACAPKEESSEPAGGDYPVYNSQWGPDHYDDICMSYRGAAEHPDCPEYFENQFQYQLAVYYNGTVDIFNACDSNAYLCRDFHAMERLMRNVRAFDSENWGW